ncbi:MAG: response regulator, partial [Actinomycetota bacterium]
MTHEETQPVTLLICDDHKTLTDALSMVVERDAGLRMVAPAVQNADRAVDLCREHRPEVVLMDVEFKSGIGGIEATRRIKENWPATKVVIMTAHDDERLLVEAVEAGASGFLGKDEPADEVLAAVKAAAEGEVLIDPSILARLLHQVSKERDERREV